jgi:hypothetical protein
MARIMWLESTDKTTSIAFMEARMLKIIFAA